MTPATAPDNLELPRPPGAVRRYLVAHPLIVDSVLAGIYLVPTLASATLTMRVEPSMAVGLWLTLTAVTGASLFARRMHPRAVFTITIVLPVLSVFFGRETYFDYVPAMFALYAMAVYHSSRAAWIGYSITAAATIASLFASRLVTKAHDSATDMMIVVFGVLAFCIVAVLVGSNVGNRRRYLAALIDRARQLARERDQQAERATVAERSRIAREMHDIVSHSLTVMITLADGSARLATVAPERTADTMRLVAETGRGALGDMRRLLGVLRTGDGEAVAHAPQPGLNELSELVERFRAAGLPVRITITGRPPSDVGQQLTIFRVVQEALTNALRYAALATSVVVTITFDSESITIIVEDDATIHPVSTQGSERGLLGLRERVALYGGTLDAGPRTGGGWRLRATVPTIVAPTSEDLTIEPHRRPA